MPASQGSPLAPREFSPRRVRADAIAVLALGLVAAASVVSLSIAEYLRRFVPGGVTWSVPVQPMEITATGLAVYDRDGAATPAAVAGAVGRLDVVVPDLNPASTVCLALAIAVASLTALTVIACISRLTWSVLRGRFFTRAASRALSLATWVGAGGALGAFALWHFAANGVSAALQVRAAETGAPAWWGWYWIILFALTASGLLDIALRRAVRLERETEGLV